MIEYEGTSEETLLPGIPGYTPVDALNGVLADLRGNLPQTQGSAEWDGLACLLATYTSQTDGTELEKHIWLEQESGAVRHCEFFVDGQMFMAMDIVSLSIF